MVPVWISVVRLEGVADLVISIWRFCDFETCLNWWRRDIQWEGGRGSLVKS